MDDNNTYLSRAGFKAFGLGLMGPAKSSGIAASGGRYPYESGFWNGNSVLDADLGEVVWITGENINALGTHIEIYSNNDGGRSLILPPFGRFIFKFRVLREEPVSWYFTISSLSDAFHVRYTVESTVVP